MSRESRLELTTFDTDFGWSAVLADKTSVKRILFGCATRMAVLRALPEEQLELSGDGKQWKWLVERVIAYAAGSRVEFRDVPLDLADLTDFQRSVIKHCRAIPFGKTLSYGELAKQSGSIGAARAVGSTMAGNRYPIVVPCHRVILAGGKLGPYSAPDGPRMKRRLLDLEAETLARAAGSKGHAGRTPRDKA